MPFTLTVGATLAQWNKGLMNFTLTVRGVGFSIRPRRFRPYPDRLGADSFSAGSKRQRRARQRAGKRWRAQVWNSSIR